MLATNSLLARLAASADSFATQQIARLRGDALAQHDHPGQGEDDDAGEDADEAQARGRRSRTPAPAAARRRRRSAPAAGSERPCRWMPPVATWTLQMPRTRSWLPGCSGSSACGVVRASSIGGERRAVGVEDAASGPRASTRARRRRARSRTSCASAAPPARRAGFSVSGSTGGRGAGPPDLRVLEDQAVAGAGGGEADGLDDVADAARRAARTVRTSSAPVPSLR